MAETTPRVLIVDDERFFREAIQEVLAEAGIDCEALESGERCLAAARDLQVGVVEVHTTADQTEAADAREEQQPQPVSVQDHPGEPGVLCVHPVDQVRENHARGQHDPSHEASARPVLAEDEDIEAEELRDRNHDSPEGAHDHAVV